MDSPPQGRTHAARVCSKCGLTFGSAFAYKQHLGKHRTESSSSSLRARLVPPPRKKKPKYLCAFADCRLPCDEDELDEHLRIYHADKNGNIARYFENTHKLCFSSEWALKEFLCRTNGESTTDLFDLFMPAIGSLSPPSSPATSLENLRIAERYRLHVSFKTRSHRCIPDCAFYLKRPPSLDE
jgi:hypothetical protein